ncbi:MAG: hypothetical protein HRT44_00030 [Bdellovibrionales bacterium]|nr:hypothetical protein [Bdellovibrionales bacterium]NQZ17645.1 hypothetical protein [Bdellovibrionales bacterium]
MMISSGFTLLPLGIALYLFFGQILSLFLTQVKGSTSDIEITKITFDKKSLIWSNGVPLRGLKIEACARILQKNGADQVEISFRTLDKYREIDLFKYTRRLKKICEKSGYSQLNGWQNRVRKSFVFENEFITIISKEKNINLTSTTIKGTLS